MFNENYYEVFSNENEFLSQIKKFTDATRWISNDFHIPLMVKYQNGIFTVKIKTSEDTYEYIPVSAVGNNSLVERAGIKGPSLFKVPETHLEAFMNECFKVTEKSELLNVVDGTIFATHSGNYKILELDQLFYSASQIIRTNFEDARFIKGYIDPIIAFVDFDLSLHPGINQHYLEAVRKIDGRDGLQVESLLPIVRIISSNAGLSGANICPYFKIGGNIIPAGHSLSLEHKGNSTVEKFKENLEMIYALLKDAYKDIAKLHKIIINNPFSCLCNIAKRVGLPKSLTIPIAEEFEWLSLSETVSAYDMYILLGNVITRAKKENKKESDLLVLQESLARILSIKISDYDKTMCEWVVKRPDKSPIPFSQLEFAM